MSADYAERRFASPSREEIAARVADGDPADEFFRRRDAAQAAVGETAAAALQPGTPEPGPLANFAVHLQARMRALGWDQAQLMERAGIKTPQVAARAINGTGVDLGLAGRIAGAVGGYLATMIGPYSCSTCHGEPPEGYGCLECGTESRPS